MPCSLRGRATGSEGVMVQPYESPLFHASGAVRWWIMGRTFDRGPRCVVLSPSSAWVPRAPGYRCHQCATLVLPRLPWRRLGKPSPRAFLA